MCNCPASFRNSLINIRRLIGEKRRFLLRKTGSMWTWGHVHSLLPCSNGFVPCVYMNCAVVVPSSFCSCFERICAIRNAGAVGVAVVYKLCIGSHTPKCYRTYTLQIAAEYDACDTAAVMKCFVTNYLTAWKVYCTCKSAAKLKSTLANWCTVRNINRT